jgi:hypothetical protein
MMAWRSLAILASVVVFAGVGRAQTYTLQEKELKNAHFQISLSLDLKGTLIIQQEGKQVSLPQTATATHEYIERVLQEGEQGMIGKSARLYKSAKAVISVAKDRTERTFRPERCLLIAQHVKDTTLTFCPKGTLTPEELDLTRHFDTLALPGLLPQKKVAIGDHWTLPNAVAQTLCSFDGLTKQEINCTLVSVEKDKALVAINGHAAGIDSGATVNLTIEGNFHFDLTAGRVVSLRWIQKEERDQGPVSPGAKADVTIQLTRAAAEPVPQVNDFALVPALDWKVPPESITALSFNDPKGRYSLTLSRDWNIVAQTKTHLILRLLDRGEFIAQATVVDWPKAVAGKHMSEEEFKKAMAEAPGWEQEQAKGEKKLDSNGNWIYRLEVDGKLNGLPTKQYLYHFANPAGNQLVLAFTMTPQQVTKLGNREEDLWRSVTLPGMQKKE